MSRPIRLLRVFLLLWLLGWIACAFDSHRRAAALRVLTDAIGRDNKRLHDVRRRLFQIVEFGCVPEVQTHVVEKSVLIIEELSVNNKRRKEQLPGRDYCGWLVLPVFGRPGLPANDSKLANLKNMLLSLEQSLTSARADAQTAREKCRR